MAQTQTRHPLRRTTDPANLAAARAAVARLALAARQLIAESVTPHSMEKIDVFAHWLQKERATVQRMHERHMAELQAKRAITSRN